jgi:hypothetical protein
VKKKIKKSEIERNENGNQNDDDGKNHRLSARRPIDMFQLPLRVFDVCDE